MIAATKCMLQFFHSPLSMLLPHSHSTRRVVIQRGTIGERTNKHTQGRRYIMRVLLKCSVYIHFNHVLLLLLLLGIQQMRPSLCLTRMSTFTFTSLSSHSLRWLFHVTGTINIPYMYEVPLNYIGIYLLRPRTHRLKEPYLAVVFYYPPCLP